MRQSRSQDPARRRRGFVAKRRVKVAQRVNTVLDQERAIVDGAALIGDVEMSCAAVTKKLKAISNRSHATYTPSLKVAGKINGAIVMEAKMQCRSIKVGEEKKKVTFLPPPETISAQRMKKSAI